MGARWAELIDAYKGSGRGDEAWAPSTVAASKRLRVTMARIFPFD
jgi:hypothetical protein